MAVEAWHLNHFPPQLLGNNREMMNPTAETNTNIYSTQMGYGLPLSGTTATTTETPIRIYSSMIADSMPQKTTIKSDSGLTYNLPVSRKRSRESMNVPSPPYRIHQSNNSCNPPSFLGLDLSLQMQQQQLDIDSLISHHMEKVRMEIEEKRKRQARRIVQAVEEGIIKRLKAKEEEIEKIGKLNWALEEKVKSLCIENQIWRELAQTNEAAANALRSNLEQVLAAQVKDEHTHGAGLGEAAAGIDDAQSSCGSGGGDWESCSDRCTLGGCVQDKGVRNSSGERLCRNCRKEESCVLLLPCRHLCLCTVCGSTVHTCPVCKATKNASFHVNMS